MCVCVQVDEVIKPKVVVVCQTKVLVCKDVCSSTKDKLWCGVQDPITWGMGGSPFFLICRN